MFGYRKELPTCEFGVGALTEGGIENCGEPAVALWDLGESGKMYVCGSHDRIVEQLEGDEESLGGLDCLHIENNSRIAAGLEPIGDDDSAP
jgi:hypothetical protein